MEITKSEFSDWKRHPVTQQVFSQLQERINFYNAMLLDQAATADPRVLVEYATVVKATRDLMNMEYEGEDS